MIVGSNILAGASGQAGYFLNRSVRTRSSASAYFNRTPSVAGNQQRFTLSGWVKLGTISTEMMFLDAGTGNASDFRLMILSGGALGVISFNGTVYTTRIETTAVFRDPSSWYHIVFAIDTTQATASNRVLIYVNGVLQTALSQTTYMSQNFNTFINSVTSHTLGRYSWANSSYLDGYQTEINFIDGQQLTPTSFGEYNILTGVWQPKKYIGTYGTNGFYLNFNDNSAATAAAIGKDSSGNGNNWTPNNISVTAGVTYDSMTDVPTLTSATQANYPVLNPLTSLSGRTSLSAANLQTLGTSAIESGLDYGTIGVTSGKWYWENTVVAVSGSYPNFGAVRVLYNPSNGKFVGDNLTGGTGIFANGNIYKENSLLTTVATYTTGNIIGIALDLDNLTCAFYKNNTLLYTTTGLTAGTYWAGLASYNSSSSAINFGQRPFSYTPPAGFIALNTYNLPTPTIANGGKYMAATLYTGTNGVAGSVTGVNFQPDFVWGKRRGTGSHGLFDSVRGVQKWLASDLTNAESTSSAFLTSFNSDGFSYGTSSLLSEGNIVAWQWKASNAAAVTNTSGTISSQVSANPSAGFSVVTYTGTGANATVGHGLGIAPKMLIVKHRSGGGLSTQDWDVYHSNLTSAAYRLFLNTTAAQASAPQAWNSTAPTSTVFSIGTGTDVNGSGAAYVAYCFSEIAGYSKFGSYTGNGSADGTFVYTGFRPRFIMIKCTSASGTDWFIEDTSRNPYNVSGKTLQANTLAAESNNAPTMDILSNGFKLRSTYSSYNTNGGTYIYAAFCESPFNYSLAR